MVADDWMPASAVRPLLHGDPCLLWLQLHGREHGFTPDVSRYDFLPWIGAQAKQFEDAWLTYVAEPDVVVNCEQPYLVRHAEYVFRTIDLMAAQVPVIFQAAMWCPQLAIYGTADVIVLRSWLARKFPELFPNPRGGDGYVAGDLKFQNGLLTSQYKRADYNVASAQIRLYAAMLANIQQEESEFGILVTRDRPLEPVRIESNYAPGGGLDAQLSECLRAYQDIRQCGRERTPWTDASLRPNLQFTSDGPWHGAKLEIATDRIPGGMPERLYYIARAEADTLRRRGYPTLQSMLDESPEKLPLRNSTTGQRQRAILHANRTGRHTPVSKGLLPPVKPVELYVDFESFVGLHCDCFSDWPRLAGKEMAAFMVGIGRMTDPGWEQSILVAPSEGREGEAELFRRFVEHLESLGLVSKPQDCVVYHWSGYERWQTQRAIDRIGDETGSKLGIIQGCFVDLCAVMQTGPVAVPGMWDYSVKSVIAALGNYDPSYRADYPDDGVLEGASAMVAGWRMFEQPEPCRTPEYADLCAYLGNDCLALHRILSWLRDVAQ